MLKRKQEVSRTLTGTFEKLNQIIRGWINYFRIGSMKLFLSQFGQWLRHKVRVIIIKQWKKPRAIYSRLMKLNTVLKCGFDKERIRIVANSRMGWYARSNGDVVNFILSSKLLAVPNKKTGRPGLINPLDYYLR